MTGVYQVESARGPRLYTTTAATERQARKWAAEELRAGAALVVIVDPQGARWELTADDMAHQAQQRGAELVAQLGLFAPEPAPNAIRGGL